MSHMASHTSSMKIVVQRWRTARDAYRRDRSKVYKTKSGQAAKSLKKYVYFENLKFLDGVLTLNNTETSFQDSVEGGEIGTRHDDSDLSGHEEHGQENIGEKPGASGTPETRKRFERKKRKKDDILDEKIMSMLGKSEEKATDEEDADREFLISLLPTLKGFDEDKKLQFRPEVLRIMIDIKKVRPDNYQPLPQMNDLRAYRHSQSSGPPMNYGYRAFRPHPNYYSSKSQSSASCSRPPSAEYASNCSPSPASSYETLPSNQSHQPTLTQLTGMNIQEYFEL